eukprot:g10929.t1
MHGAIADGVRVPAVTVFGWDDVLCPTTHARLGHKRTARAYGVPEPAGGDARAATERKELLKVGQSVVRLVKAAQRYGPVVIVTDSHERWVRGTAALLLPGGSAAACLEDVEIVSSRERFGGDFPEQPACWQIAAFSYVTNRHLLSAGAVARVRRADAAAAAGKSAGGDGDGDGDAAAAKEVGDGPAEGGSGGEEAPPAAEGSIGGRAESRQRRGHRQGSSSDSGGGGGGGDGDGEVLAGGVGTLMAVATSKRAAEDKAAALTLREHHPNIVAKTVSLMEAPTPLELKEQLDLLADKFELMFGHAHASSPRTPSTASPSPSSSASMASPPAELGGGDGDGNEEETRGPDGESRLWDLSGSSSSCPSSPSSSAAPESPPSAAAVSASARGTAAVGKPEPPEMHCLSVNDEDVDEDDKDYLTATCSASTMSSSSSTGSGLAWTPYHAQREASSAAAALLSPLRGLGWETVAHPPPPPPPPRRRKPRAAATAAAAAKK